MSFSGSALRIWRLSELSESPWLRWGLLVPAAVLAILCAWVVVAVWYVVWIVAFGLLFVPFRLLTRSRRKRKIEAARHRELLASQAAAGSAESRSASR